MENISSWPENESLIIFRFAHAPSYQKVVWKSNIWIFWAVGAFVIFWKSFWAFSLVNGDTALFDNIVEFFMGEHYR